MIGGLTIGQAAAFAGVTVKTVRHYHRLGLVTEPRRDTSGYRRYGSAELLRLIKVRTLAESGVPLAEIADLLDSGPERFASGVADVKQRLTERIDELIARRDMLDRLDTDNRLLLPDRALALLDRFVELGFPEDHLPASQEDLILAKVLVPDFDEYLAEAERLFDDDRYVELLKLGAEAGAWEPDDPRVEKLAATFADYLLANPDMMTVSTSLHGTPDATERYRLVNERQSEGSPTWARLSALVDARLRAAGVAE